MNNTQQQTQECVLTFAEKTHEYRLNRKIVPSVTQVLAPISKILYSNIKEKTLEHKARIGTKVHKLIEQYLAYGIIPSKNNDEAVLDYFNSFLMWKQNIKEKVVILKTECKGFYQSNDMTFAGTLDCVMAVGTKIVNIDWKTVANPNDTILSLQLYGYRLIGEQFYKMHFNECAALCLRKDGYEYHDVTKLVEEPSTEKLFKHLYELYRLLEYSGIREEAKSYNDENF